MSFPRKSMSIPNIIRNHSNSSWISSISDHFSPESPTLVYHNYNLAFSSDFHIVEVLGLRSGAKLCLETHDRLIALAGAWFVFEKIPAQREILTPPHQYFFHASITITQVFPIQNLIWWMCMHARRVCINALKKLLTTKIGNFFPSKLLFSSGFC